MYALTNSKLSGLTSFSEPFNARPRAQRPGARVVRGLDPLRHTGARVTPGVRGTYRGARAATGVVITLLNTGRQRGRPDSVRL